MQYWAPGVTRGSHRRLIARRPRSASAYGLGFSGPSLHGGWSVEVFESEGDAKKRTAYIEGIRQEQNG